MADTKLSAKDMFLRAIAVLGLIAVLLLGAWGIIQIAANLPSFLGGVGSGVASVFEREPRATSTPASPAAPRTPQPTGGAAAPAAPTVTGGSAAVSAAPRYNLFGYPDLAVRILSRNTYRGHTTVSFEIANWGTNIAQKGWSFVAELPLGRDEYPYSSVGQQQLYPGDRIIYTLGFSADDYRYDYDDDCEWDEDEDEWDCDDDRRRNDDEVRIVVDPYGYVFESNERNNSVDFEI